MDSVDLLFIVLRASGRPAFNFYVTALTLNILLKRFRDLHHVSFCPRP